MPFDFGKIINSAKEAGAFLGFADGGGGGNEARRAEVRGPKGPNARSVGPRAGMGFLGRGKPAPSSPARGSGGALQGGFVFTRRLSVCLSVC